MYACVHVQRIMLQLTNATECHIQLMPSYVCVSLFFGFLCFRSYTFALTFLAQHDQPSILCRCRRLQAAYHNNDKHITKPKMWQFHSIHQLAS